MKGNLQIVIAWTEDVQELDEARSRNVRRDLGEANKFKDVKKPFAAMWLNKGTEADVAKARAYAGGEGKKVFVYIGAGDPLGRAKADVLRGKATDIALIPEADGTEFIKPTDGARQAFKGWASGKQHVGDSKRKVVCPTCKKQLTPTEGRTVPFHVGKNMKACRGSNSVGAEWADPYAPAKDSKCWMCGGSMSGAGKYDDVCPDCMHPRAKKSINLPPAEAAKVRTANKALRRAKAGDSSGAWSKNGDTYSYNVGATEIGYVEQTASGDFLAGRGKGKFSKGFKKLSEAKQWVENASQAHDAVTMEEIAEAGRAMVAAQRSGDKAKIHATRNAYRALRDQAEREENEHYVAVKRLNRRPDAEKEHQSMLRAMKHGPGAKAQDGILSSPFMALAALLAILNHFNKETVGPQDYDLTTYRPKKKEW